jgi:hypothetical protein
MSIGYHQIKTGMRFLERGKLARVITVEEALLYSVVGRVEVGRGKGSTLQLFRKALSNPEKWERISDSKKESET